MSNSVCHYQQEELPGATDQHGSISSSLCPPASYGSRAKWTALHHKVKGPVGLLCVALAEHRAALSPQLCVLAWPHFSFHLQFAPKQQLRKLVDIVVTEAHFAFLATNRTALAAMDTFDKTVYHAACAKFSSEEKRTLLAVQSLGTWSAGKAKEHFREGDGTCPHCGSLDTGALHEVWSCKGLRSIQLREDEDLEWLSTDNTTAHILLGLPSQMEPDYACGLIPSKQGTGHWLSRRGEALELQWHDGSRCPETSGGHQALWGSNSQPNYSQVRGACDGTSSF